MLIVAGLYGVTAFVVLIVFIRDAIRGPIDSDDAGPR